MCCWQAFRAFLKLAWNEMEMVQVQMICALGLSSTQWARKKVQFFFSNHILDVIYEKTAPRLNLASLCRSHRSVKWQKDPVG